MFQNTDRRFYKLHSSAPCVKRSENVEWRGSPGGGTKCMGRRRVEKSEERLNTSHRVKRATDGEREHAPFGFGSRHIHKHYLRAMGRIVQWRHHGRWVGADPHLCSDPSWDYANPLKIFIYIGGPIYVYCNFYCSPAKKKIIPYFFGAGDATAGDASTLHRGITKVTKIEKFPHFNHFIIFSWFYLFYTSLWLVQRYFINNNKCGHNKIVIIVCRRHRNASRIEIQAVVKQLEIIFLSITHTPQFCWHLQQPMQDSTLSEQPWTYKG